MVDLEAGDVPGTAPRPVRVEHPARRPGSTDIVDGVCLVTIDRPQVLNALDAATMRALVAALEALDADPTCRCIVITGAGDRAFAAGADIRDMLPLTASEAIESPYFRAWDRVAAIDTPIIAAVRGYALGGGCELALACDTIVCSTDAVFGQPEVSLGIIPGAGGTQRLTRAVGTATAADLVLTGRRLTAAEAEARGLVSRVVPPDELLAIAVDMAARIASAAPLAIRAAKASLRAATGPSLAEGLAHERAAFARLFDTEDQKEGMGAFLEKRPPAWKGR